MPTYEYACNKCGHQFEIFQSMKDKSLTVCPKDKCKLKRWGKGRVKKLLGSGAGLIFKGSGFYITDYRSEKYKEAAKKESSSASGGKESSTGASADKSKGAAPAKSAPPAKPKSDS
jgi:putative FmdB family regulatory protein